MFINRLELFVHNFMFLSTFSRKLYKHLNMFIRIGHVSWHLLNMFLSIFVTILLFFISTNQNHFKIKKKPNFIISNLNQNQPNPQKNIRPNKTFNFYYFQTVINHQNPHKYNQTPTPNIKTLLFPNPNKTQIFKPKSDLKSTLSNPNFFKLQTSIEEKPSGERFQTLTKSSKPSQIQLNSNFKHQNFVIPKPK
jgi:hypothetical protein